MLEKKKALKWLAVFIVVGLLLAAMVTVVFDPFYQYHMPWFGLNEVLRDRDNQVIGTIRNAEYDSVLLGSSVSENFDSDYWDAAQGTESIKVIRASGSIADLLYYMEKAHKQQELKQVLWCMDIFALTASTEVTLYDESVPRYLHTETVLDDVTYLFNKEILFEKIPQMLVFSMQRKYAGGQAYNWAEGKEFGAAKAMQAYAKPESFVLEADSQTTEFRENLQANIAMVQEEITSHPEIEYTIVFPPYSMLWWDSGYVNNLADEYFLVLEEVLPMLTGLSNVKVYYFQADKEIVCDLDNYMDMLHYKPEINQYMLESVVEDTHRVTAENCQETIAKMRDTYEYIIKEGIYLYYTK